MLYKVALIGFGAANMLFLAYIASSAPELLDDTVIIDPTLNGGALQNSWPNVRSNTTYNQFISALKRFSATAEFAEKISPRFALDQPTPLHVLAKSLREAIEPFMKKTTILKDKVKNITEDQNKIFKIELKDKVIQAERVIFSPGSNPKGFNYPIPTIPLHVALDNRQVDSYISAGNRVILFGTAHSGCLVLANLIGCGARVSLVYATDKPFLFAKDGEYDGIKQDAAIIADAVLANNSPYDKHVEMIYYKNTEAVLAAAMRADYACYTVGFSLESAKCFGYETGYNAETARLREGSEIYGFGIAFPSCTKVGEKVFWDVSIPSFTEHILKTNILSTVSSE